MTRGFPWSRLGIEPTPEAGAIRKAYADALRATNLDEDIAGYAELRRARDHALWLAAQGAQADHADDHVLGDLDEDWDDDDDDGFVWDAAGDDVWDDSPADHPAPLGEDGAGAPQLSEAQLRAQEAWETLLGVLYPDGAPSDEAVSFDELEQGNAALAILIARAEEADLVEHDALDDALAELLARTWPRSAPFVEPADAAFHWLGEAGSLAERPALMFLNQRLKGMRFHEKVQRPDHPLHKAGAELARPGRAGFLDRFRVKRLDVHKLLSGIRERYPELESLLDSERVASWEKAGALDGNPGGFGPSAVRWLLILVLVGAALVRLGANIAGNDSDGAAPSKEDVNAALIDAQIGIAAAEVFGPGTDLAALRNADAEFLDQLRLAMGQGSKTDVALAFVRFRATASAEIADYDQLVVRADLRGMWMRAALAQSPEACRNIMTGDFASIPLKLDDEQRAREQALLRQLLEAGVLSHIPKGGETRYAIPGWLVEDTLKRSGLPEDRLIAALRDTASPDRCTAETALIEAVRAAPGRVPIEVLKGL